MESAEGEKALVLDGPLDGLAAGEVHGLGEGGGKVDIPLFAGFAFDELDFGGEAHEGKAPFVISSY